jgi:hypothetical protein
MGIENRDTYKVLGLISIIAIGILTYFIICGIQSIEKTWVVMAVLGIAIFLVILTLMAFIFIILNVSNKGEALALPPGSIRAVIALCLVVVFVIFVIFLYNDLANPSPRSLEGLSQEQYNKISPDQILSSSEYTDNTTGQTLYKVELIGAKSPAAQDLAKQVVTLVGTLMAAVSSFYFGVKAGEGKEAKEEPTPSERKGTEKPTLSISSPSSPTTLDPSNKTLHIKLDPLPEGESIDNDSPVGDPDGTLVQTKPGEFLYTKGKQPRPKVFLSFWLAKHPDIQKTLLVETPTLDISSPSSPSKLAKQKGTELIIKMQITPKGEDVKCNDPPAGDSDGSLKQTESSVFKYTRGTKPDDKVTLNFALVNYPHVTKQLEVEAP